MMCVQKRPVRAVRLVILIPMALGLAGCDADPLAPGLLTADEVVAARGGVKGKPVEPAPDTGAVEVQELVLAPEGWNYRWTVSGVFDRKGGWLELGGGGKLEIPRGAVSEPTWFTATVTVGPYFEVDLTARGVADGVVVSAFPKSLRLKVGYLGELLGYDEKRFVLAWLAEDTPEGRKVKVPGSFANVKDKRVQGSLDHFSKYAIAIN